MVLPYVEVIALGEDEYRGAELLARHSIKPSDALHLAAALSHGISLIVSEDTELDRVPGITRLWLPETRVEPRRGQIGVLRSSPPPGSLRPILLIPRERPPCGAS